MGYLLYKAEKKKEPEHAQPQKKTEEDGSAPSF